MLQDVAAQNFVVVIIVFVVVVWVLIRGAGKGPHDPDERDRKGHDDDHGT